MNPVKKYNDHDWIYMLYISRSRMMLKCVIGLLCGLVMSLDFIDTRKGTHEIERPYVYRYIVIFFSLLLYFFHLSFPFIISLSLSIHIYFLPRVAISLSLFAFTGKLVVRNYLYTCTKTIIFHIPLPILPPPSWPWTRFIPPWMCVLFFQLLLLFHNRFATVCTFSLMSLFFCSYLCLLSVCVRSCFQLHPHPTGSSWSSLQFTSLPYGSLFLFFFSVIVSFFFSYFRAVFSVKLSKEENRICSAILVGLESVKDIIS